MSGIEYLMAPVHSVHKQVLLYAVNLNIITSGRESLYFHWFCADRLGIQLVEVRDSG